jgi:hypothetical protein
MSGYGSPHTRVHQKSPISVPWVVLSALLVGIGLFLVAFWLITMEWVWFLGLVPAVVGGVMLFDPRAGADHA